MSLSFLVTFIETNANQDPLGSQSRMLWARQATGLEGQVQTHVMAVSGGVSAVRSIFICGQMLDFSVRKLICCFLVESCSSFKPNSHATEISMLCSRLWRADTLQLVWSEESLGVEQGYKRERSMPGPECHGGGEGVMLKSMAES